MQKECPRNIVGNVKGDSTGLLNAGQNLIRDEILYSPNRETG
jgi:hypothetical protein